MLENATPEKVHKSLQCGAKASERLSKHNSKTLPRQTPTMIVGNVDFVWPYSDLGVFWGALGFARRRKSKENAIRKKQKQLDEEKHTTTIISVILGSLSGPQNSGRFEVFEGLCPKARRGGSRTSHGTQNAQMWSSKYDKKVSNSCFSWCCNGFSGLLLQRKVAHALPRHGHYVITMRFPHDDYYAMQCIRLNLCSHFASSHLPQLFILQGKRKNTHCRD